MNFTQDFIQAADKFFDALKKLDGTVKAKANSATMTEAAPVTDKAQDEAKSEQPKETPVANAQTEAPDTSKAVANDAIDELKKKVEALSAELTSVKANLNSTIGLNTELTEKLAVILNAPAEGSMKPVENSRPTEAKKNDFKAWDDVINARLNHKSKI